MLRAVATVSVCLFCCLVCAGALVHCERTRIPRRLIRENRVNVVYTMESSCEMCVQQASRLPHLKRYLEKKGIKTHFIIGVSHGSDKLSGLVPHVQVNNRQVWRSLGNQNNHFYVIDRCGRMVFEVINPWSNLNFPFVRSAVVATQHSHRCGLCPADYTHVSSEEKVIEYSEHRASSEYIPENTMPLKMVVKIKHRHKTDPKIYNHIVRIPEIPKYHGHLPNDGHMPTLQALHNGGRTNDRELRRHSVSLDIPEEEDEPSGERIKNSSLEDSSFNKTENLNTTDTSETTTSSSTNKESSSTPELNDRKQIFILDNANPSQPTKINNDEKSNDEAQEIKVSGKDQGETSKDYYEEDPPDAYRQKLTKEQIAEKELLFNHYKLILDWIHYTNDYD